MAAAHGASVFSLGAGSVSFAQIVKSCEPAFAAVIGALLYNKAVSKAKWLSLIPVIGGVAIASATELNFSLAALFGACIANCFAAFKGNENKKLMETAGIRERLGTVGNQFAVTNLLAFLISTPIALAKEGSRFPEFLELCKTSSVVWNNMLASGILFYLYNELATMTIKKTSAVTQSVANTAKRAIVILGVAIALGESLSPTKIVGSVICILGVLLYSNADSLFPPKQKSA
uniref:Sugar phosphate transporter domain-containing protein n=3 Tax=Pinguiococcus pyrenoidosus TaxID=172671 RepID=A0A7R9U6B4_9STRA